jgi:hypothetical protein
MAETLRGLSASAVSTQRFLTGSASFRAPIDGGAAAIERATPPCEGSGRSLVFLLVAPSKLRTMMGHMAVDGTLSLTGTSRRGQVLNVKPTCHSPALVVSA